VRAFGAIGFLAVNAHHGKRAVLPRLESPREGPDPIDPEIAETERHTGACGLVWSSAEDDDILASGNLRLTLLHLVWSHPERAGDRLRKHLELGGVAEVHHDEVLAPVQ
jgi:hypothetical protein